MYNIWGTKALTFSLRLLNFRLRCCKYVLCTGLQHERGEVRQMCSALLNNFSLLLASAKKSAGTPIEMSDEVTQILFGVLDGLRDETSQVCGVWCVRYGCLFLVPFGIRPGQLADKWKPVHFSPTKWLAFVGFALCQSTDSPYPCCPV